MMSPKGCSDWLGVGVWVRDGDALVLLVVVRVIVRVAEGVLVVVSEDVSVPLGVPDAVGDPLGVGKDDNVPVLLAVLLVVC